MKRFCSIFVAALVLLPAAASAFESNETGERQSAFVAGDALQVAVPLAGLALTYLLHDGGDASGGASWRGDALLSPLSLDGSPRHDFLAAALRMELATQSLKWGVNEERPNGGSHSFPSGHTAAAFMGAEFIRKEYGWGWAAPAYLAASYVGWSRVASQNHFTHDVVAGALIGIYSNHDMGRFEFPFGSMTIGPSLLSANPDREPSGAFETKGVSPGLQFHLTFGGR